MWYLLNMMEDRRAFLVRWGDSIVIETSGRSFEVVVNEAERFNRLDGLIARYFPCHKDELHLFGIVLGSENA